MTGRVRMHPLDPNVRACLVGALTHRVVIEVPMWVVGNGGCTEEECWHMAMCTVCNRPLRRLAASDCPERFGRVVNGVCVECGSAILNGEHLRLDLPPCGSEG